MHCLRTFSRLPFEILPSTTEKQKHPNEGLLLKFYQVGVTNKNTHTKNLIPHWLMLLPPSLSPVSTLVHIIYPWTTTPPLSKPNPPRKLQSQRPAHLPPSHPIHVSSRTFITAPPPHQASPPYVFHCHHSLLAQPVINIKVVTIETEKRC